ncbi:MAG TPA: acetylxylan esterase, partial [Acidobacteriota bacterium]|nr:acetylxylan esterase [Acidobacteriota bacterium]
MKKSLMGFSSVFKKMVLMSLTFILLTGTVLSRERDFPERLAGTGQLQVPDDIFQRLHQQMDDYFLRRIKATPSHRDELWRPDFSSEDRYRQSVEKHRSNLWELLGLRKYSPVLYRHLLREDPVRVEEHEIRLAADYVVRALLFLPSAGERPYPAVIALGPANQMREEFAGILGEQKPDSWVADLLEQGIAVAIPALVRRSYDHPWAELSWRETMDRRRFLYRLAFVVGRTMPGLEVQQVLALRQELAEDERLDRNAISVMGLEQGGMTAFYSAALDPEISGAVIADYFCQRENVWREPVDRTLWGQLEEFGDAEIAALIAPRPLSILTAEKGAISTISVQVEADRARRYYRGLNQLEQFQTRSYQGLRDVTGEVARLHGRVTEGHAVELPVFTKEEARRVDQQQFDELHRYLRGEIERSRDARAEYWALTKVSDENRRTLVTGMRKELRRLMGVVSSEGFPLSPRTSLIEVNENFAAYQVLLDVAPGLEAWGHLLVPRNLTGRAPAVIAQHGGGGTPAMVTGVGFEGDTAYHAFGRHLAGRGYVVFAPMIAVANIPFPDAEDRLEAIRLGLLRAINPKVRMAASLGMMRTSIEQARLGRIVNFLQSLDFVDGERIGYYGLSYGGYSAIWMTALEPRIKATVISGHFNDWEQKITSHRIATSYLRHPDEDFTNWNVLNRFSHLELIAAMWPTAVCVEYGERDAVTPPGWF